MSEPSATTHTSIIIPVKDRRELIEQTLASLQAQTLRDWEAVVVDDGSTDGTIEAIEARAADDARIRLIRREGQRRGAPVCRNLGARAARGARLSGPRVSERSYSYVCRECAGQCSAGRAARLP